MINREVYELSMSILGLGTKATDNADFYSRAPYLLALFCIESFELDAHLRRQLGIEPIDEIEQLRLDMNEDFPLLDSLIPPATLYLAAMLVLDEDEALYEKLYEHYCDRISALQSGLPFELESIENCYFSG